jgi:hypothetical protein
MNADWVSAAANVAMAFATFAAVGIACRGLEIWREELRARAQHDTALKVLTTLFKVDAAIKALRSPVMSSLEWQGRPRDPNEDDHTRQALDTIYALSMRHNRVIETFPEWETALAEARALWGDLLTAPANVVRGKVGAFQANLNLYSAMMRGQLPLKPEDARRLEQFIYSGPWPDETGEGQIEDAVAKEIDAAVAAIKNKLQPFIYSGPRRTLWG